MTATTDTWSSKRKIRAAIIGVGNCGSSLVRDVESYKDASTGELIPGMMHVNHGGYHDDIAREKVEEFICETALRESGVEADVPVETPAD